MERLLMFKRIYTTIMRVCRELGVAKREGIYFSRWRRQRWPWILLILVVAAMIVPAAIYFEQSPEEPSQMRAVILDRLAADYPNQTFIESAIEVLREAGFEVDVYGPENISLSLLRGLHQGSTASCFSGLMAGG